MNYPPKYTKEQAEEFCNKMGMKFISYEIPKEDYPMCEILVEYPDGRLAIWRSDAWHGCGGFSPIIVDF